MNAKGRLWTAVFMAALGGVVLEARNADVETTTGEVIHLGVHSPTKSMTVAVAIPGDLVTANVSRAAWDTLQVGDVLRVVRRRGKVTGFAGPWRLDPSNWGPP